MTEAVIVAGARTPSGGRTSRAARARDERRFDQEVVPVGGFARDEHARGDTTLEKLASLPVLHPELEKSVVTAGNSAGLNEAAAAVVYRALMGEHEDWDAYRKAMVTERRAVVRFTPNRSYGMLQLPPRSGS